MSDTHKAARVLVNDWYAQTEMAQTQSAKIGFDEQEWEQLFDRVAIALTQAERRGMGRAAEIVRREKCYADDHRDFQRDVRQAIRMAMGALT